MNHFVTNSLQLIRVKQEGKNIISYSASIETFSFGCSSIGPSLKSSIGAKEGTSIVASEGTSAGIGALTSIGVGVSIGIASLSSSSLSFVCYMLGMI